jgi:hypothetical protein
MLAVFIVARSAGAGERGRAMMRRWTNPLDLASSCVGARSPALGLLLLLVRGGWELTW